MAAFYSEKVMDHFANPRNVGELEDANGVGEIGNAKCGDIMKMYIKVEDGRIVKAESPVITCQCIRVPVLNGHTAAAFVKFRKKVTKEQLIEKLVAFKGLPQELALPSAPKQFIQYLEEDNRPQVTADVDFENGMGISIGRLREDKVYDYKFVGLSHNTVRGAAGGAVLCAELLTAKGYIQAK